MSDTFECEWDKFEAVDEFRLRWNNYKSKNRKHQRLVSCMHEHVLEHFNEEGYHTLWQNRPFRTLKKKKLLEKCS